MSFNMTDEEKRDPRRLVLWLAEATEHTDNITEFVNVVLTHLWTEVGLPGEMPRDEHGFIDLAAIQRASESLSKWPDIDALAAEHGERITEYEARFYSFENKAGLGPVEDAAWAAGFEAYPFKHDLVVVSPDRARLSKP